MNEVNIMNKVNTMNEVNIMNKVSEVNTIKRIWTKGISVESDISIDIWDSGSHIYERWPDGDVCWKVISRELVESGYSEVLQKMPEWFSPGQVLHRKHLPLILEPLQLGQWKLKVSEQVLEPVVAQKSIVYEKTGMEGKTGKQLVHIKHGVHGRRALQPQLQHSRPIPLPQLQPRSQQSRPRQQPHLPSQLRVQVKAQTKSLLS